MHALWEDHVGAAQCSERHRQPQSHRTPTYWQVFTLTPVNGRCSRCLRSTPERCTFDWVAGTGLTRESFWNRGHQPTLNFIVPTRHKECNSDRSASTVKCWLLEIWPLQMLETMMTRNSSIFIPLRLVSTLALASRSPVYLSPSYSG